MKSIHLLPLLLLLACLSAPLAVAADGHEPFLQMIGFVPDHVEISGFIVADYLKANPRVFKVEAEGGIAATRFFAELLGRNERKEFDEKTYRGAAGGSAFTLKLSKGKQSAEIIFSGIDTLTIRHPLPPRAFKILPDLQSQTFYADLADSLAYHQKGDRKIWRRVVLTEPK